MTFHHIGERTEVLDTAIGASTQEDVVDGMAQQLLARLKAHILQRLHETGLLGLGDLVERRYRPVNADAHAGICAIGDAWLYILGVEGQLLVEDGIVAALQRLPIGHSLIPVSTLGRILTALEVFERCLVGSHKAATCSHLNREVTEGETTVHRHVADDITGIFNEVTRCARGSQLTHEVEGHVFRRHTALQLAVDVDAHGLRLLLQDALRGQHHLNLGGADTESHSTYSTMRRRMTVTTDDGHARQRQGLLGTDDMDDTIVLGVHLKLGQSKLITVLVERVNLETSHGVSDRLVLVMGLNVMVGHEEVLLRAEHLKPAFAQTVKSLRGGHLMAIEPVDIKLGRTVLYNLHNVPVPDFIKKSIHIAL